MNCDRERRHARKLDRDRCERFDNPPNKRPDPDWLLSEYASIPAHVIASRLGVTEYLVWRWIDLAKQRHVYKQNFHKKRA